MIISAAVIVAYTTIGGFLAASTTDFVQSIIMTVALITVLGFGTGVAGGFGAVMENARSMGDYLSLTSTFNVATRESGAFGPFAIVSTLAWGLGYFGMPHILLRFMAIEDAKKLKLSRRIASIWVVISMGVAILIGVIGYGMTSAGAVELLETSGTAETIIVKIAGLLAENGAFAALVAGVILAGILAATMSTADSQLLAAASSVSQNIIAPFAKKGVFHQDQYADCTDYGHCNFGCGNCARQRPERFCFSRRFFLHGRVLAQRSVRSSCFRCSGSARRLQARCPV